MASYETLTSLTWTSAPLRNSNVEIDSWILNASDRFHDALHISDSNSAKSVFVRPAHKIALDMQDDNTVARNLLNSSLRDVN